LSVSLCVFFRRFRQHHLPPMRIIFHRVPHGEVERDIRWSIIPPIRAKRSRSTDLVTPLKPLEAMWRSAGSPQH
jgi:hypothetical protein